MPEPEPERLPEPEPEHLSHPGSVSPYTSSINRKLETGADKPTPRAVEWQLAPAGACGGSGRFGEVNSQRSWARRALVPLLRKTCCVGGVPDLYRPATPSPKTYDRWWSPESRGPRCARNSNTTPMKRLLAGIWVYFQSA